MDSSGERESCSGISQALSDKINRLIDSIDANTYAMRQLNAALIDQDDQDDDSNMGTYLDGSLR